MTVRAVLLLRRAARLCGATVAWNLTVGGAAIATALLTGSLSLIGFGINAVVDSSVSSLLVWRFRAEERGHAERAMRVERLAVRVAGAAFTIVAIYVFVRAVVALVNRGHASASLFGIAEALASLVVLPYLAVGKYRLSVRLGSRALRADSLLTVSGVALATIALMGLILQRTVGWWWADPVAALVIAVFLAVRRRLGAVRAPRGRRASARSRVMSSRHLSCEDCRIRVRASAPEIELLEGSCPICGATLRAVPFPSGVMGFRSFDLDALSGQGPSGPPPTPGQPVDLTVRREAALARDGFDADRWSDEGGSVSGEAVAEWPAAH